MQALELQGKGLNNREFFLILFRNTPVLGLTHPPIHLVTGAFSLVVKLPKYDANHSHPYIADVKNNWSYDSTASYTFKSYTRNNLAFMLLSMVHCCG
jgi:hypothetical protein